VRCSSLAKALPLTHDDVGSRAAPEKGSMERN
jgi:hypothetical protein